MKLLDALKTRIGGHADAPLAAGGRLPFTKAIAEAVREHLPELQKADLSRYTFERRPTMYPGASNDLVIYDQNGGQIARGRETDAGRVVLWR